MEFDTELRLHRSDYTLFQPDNLLRICLTGIIHDHQRLLLPYRRAAAPASLPSALLDHPSCRDLDKLLWRRSFTSFRMTGRRFRMTWRWFRMTWRWFRFNDIMRNLIVRTELGLRRRLDTLEMLTADDRILEETTRTAHNRRLRQLLLPDLNYNLTNHHRSQPGSSFCIAFRRHATPG